MREKKPTKLNTMQVLEILQKYTDENHRLSQSDIIAQFKKDYGYELGRKTFRPTIMSLLEMGYNIEYDEVLRRQPVKKNGKSVVDPKTGEVVKEDNYIWKDFYLVRDFNDSELRLLIDGLLFSRHIPYSQCKELVEKIEGLSSNYFRSRVKHISTLPKDKANNQELFNNIDLIDEAISENKKITFKYLEYDIDKKMHIKKREDGTDRVYLISPYQMAAREGKYYLICNYDKYNDISNYRLDRITDLHITDEKRKPFKSLDWANRTGLNLSEYMKRHPYMYSSDDVRVTFRVTLPMISDVIDLFGTDVNFTDKNATGVTVSTITNERAMEQFALNFAPDVIVLKPESLRKKIVENLKRAVKAYK